MSKHRDEKIKYVVKEYGPIDEFLLDYLSKLIPNYEEKIVFTNYGIFSHLQELTLQLEIAIGMDDGRYNKIIPTLIEALKMRIGQFLELIEEKKPEYIA